MGGTKKIASGMVFFSALTYGPPQKIASGMVFFATPTYFLSSLGSCFTPTHYMLEIVKLN